MKMTKPVDETALYRIHWWRDVEKVHAQLEGALMMTVIDKSFDPSEIPDWCLEATRERHIVSVSIVGAASDRNRITNRTLRS
jgi:hypothetical protein